MARLAIMVMTFLIFWLIIVSSPATLANPNCSGTPGKKAGKECRTCIVNQMKFGCPKCVPLLRCMARCLWNGTARNKCSNRCDCNGGKPSMVECKSCMSKCKCSCVA